MSRRRAGAPGPARALLACFGAVLLAGCLGAVGPSAAYYPGVAALPLPHATQQVAGAPDGSKLAYADPSGLYVVDLATNEVAPVDVPGGGQTALAWSPAGDRLYFRTPGRRLEAVTLATGEVEPLQAANPEAIRRVAASADGRLLALVKERGLFLYDLQRATEQELTSEPPREHVAWSPDGTRLAYVEGGDRPRLIAVSAYGGQPVVVADPGFGMAGAASCTPPEEGFFWAEGGEGLGWVQASTRSAVSVRTYALTGGTIDDRVVDVGDRIDLRRYVECYHPSPDGRWLVAFRGGEIGSQDRPGGLVAVEPKTGRTAEVAPPATFVAWVGTAGRFVFSTNRNLQGLTQYYLGSAAP